MLESLHPPGPTRPVAELLSDLRPRERAGADRPFTYLNMVSTVDGRAGIGGRSNALGDEADLELLLELRTLADAVLIGPHTVAVEGYDRLVRAPARRERRVAAGQAADPVAVLVSRRLDIPWDAGLFAAPEQPVLVYTASDGEPPPVAAQVEVVRLPSVTLPDVLGDLRRRGVRALLCEGGPTLNRTLFADGLLDELFLTVAPLVTAGLAEPAIVAGGPLDPPAGLALRWVLRYGDELFLRYAVAHR